MLFKIIIFLTIFVPFIQTEAPKPILDAGTGEALDIYTDAYYALMNMWTGRHLNFTNYATLYDKYYRLDIFDENFWAKFRKNDHYRKDHVYILENQYNSYIVQVSIDKNTGFYNINWCSKMNCDNCYFIDWETGQQGTLSCIQFDDSNKRLYWKFIDATSEIDKSFDVNAIMANFKYENISSDIISKHKNAEYLNTLTFSNNSTVTNSEKFILKNKTTETYSLSLDSSYVYSSRFSTTFQIITELGALIFNVLSKTSKLFGFSIDIGEQYKNKRSETWTTQNVIDISEETTINIPPKTCITALGIYSYIKDLTLQYNASVTVQVAPKDGNPEDLTMEQTLFLAGRIFGNNPDQIKGRHLIYNTSGTIVGTFGLDAFIAVQNCTGSCGDYKHIIGQYSIIDEKDKLEKLQIDTRHKSCYLRKLINVLLDHYKEKLIT